jgi:hypothetical protein
VVLPQAWCVVPEEGRGRRGGARTKGDASNEREKRRAGMKRYKEMGVSSNIKQNRACAARGMVCLDAGTKEEGCGGNCEDFENVIARNLW